MLHILILIVVFSSVCLFAYWKKSGDYNKVKKELAWYNTKFLTKNGWTKLYGDGTGLAYNLLSIDGGKTWYALNNNFAHENVQILGKVEEIYPKLIEHLDGWDKLTAYVKEHGAIGSSGTITDDDMKVLQDAGLEIKINKS